MSSLVVTGLGLASSLGNAVGGAAAVRAGLTRPADLEGVELPPEDERSRAVTGHPIVGLTDGTSYLGRWMCLAHAAVQDLMSRVDLGLAGARDRCMILLVVPEQLVERYGLLAPVSDAWLHARYGIGLVRAVIGPGAGPRVELVRGGRAGALRALMRARELIHQREVARVLVVAADSWVEPASARWLARCARLKTPDNPVGVVPGEAGACVLVESVTTARTDGRRVEAEVRSVHVERAAAQLDPATGRGLGPALSRVLEASLRASGVTMPFAGDVYVDHEGTEDQAYDLGILRLRASDVLASRARMVLPAVALGALGVASGAVALVLAARGLARNPARGEYAEVLSRADEGDVGAACLRRGESG